MTDIRIISWNILRFAAGTSGVFSKQERIDRVMEVVHPKAVNADANCDIFVIVEPVTGKQNVGTVAAGSGVTGGTQLLGILNGRAKGKDWKMVPALCIYSGKSGGETLLVFYRDSVVKLKTGGHALLTNATTTVPNWKIKGVRESCPFHVTFTIANTSIDIHLIAQHAPSPDYGSGKNGKANQGVQEVGKHLAVTGNTKVVYLGDLNLCSVPATDTDCFLDGHTEDGTTLAGLGMTLVASGQRSSLKAGDASLDDYLSHAYDNILAKGLSTSSNANVINLVKDVLDEHLLLKPGPIPAQTFKRLFHCIRTTKGKGLSDHLPVRATISF